MSKVGIKLMGMAAAAALVVTGLAANASANTELRIATLAPPGSAWMKVLDKGAAAIEQHTEKRVKVKYYSGGSQGDERDVVRKMKLGQLDGGALTSVGLAMIYEGIRVLELPMLFESIEEMDYVRKKMWPHFQKKFAAKGFQLGEPGDVGWVYFMSQNKVESLSDLRKTKVWMWTDDQVVRAMFKKLNVSGVPLGVPDVLPALQSGRINACYGSPLAAVALQWSTKVRYMTSMPMSYAIGATVVRDAAWNQISAKDQKIQRLISRKIGDKLRAVVRLDNKDAQKQMTRKGVKISTTPPAMIRDFEKAAQAVWNDLAGSVYTKAELNLVLKYRDEYRKKN